MNVKEWIRDKAVSTIFGVVILSIIASTLYDLLVKPGLSATGRLILDVLTLGSNKLRDSAYSSAAMDPTPGTSMLIVCGFCGYLTAMVIRRVILRGVLGRRKSDSDSIKNNHDVALKVVALLCIIILLVAVMAVNQSVLIWRTYNTNLLILKPYLPAGEYDYIRSQFSSMQRRSDYMAINARLNDLAIKNKVRLRNVSLW